MAKSFVMSNYIIIGATFFTLALIFYSIAIWSDYFRQKLERWHIAMFAVGVITDTLGTLFMYLHVGHLIFNSISGFLGLFLMVFHLCWGTLVIMNDNVRRQLLFHRFSLFVWFFWLVSYISGVYIGLNR